MRLTPTLGRSRRRDPRGRGRGGLTDALPSSGEGEAAAASPVERGVSAAPRRRGAANDAGCARGGRRPTSPTLQESATARARDAAAPSRGRRARADCALRGRDIEPRREGRGGAADGRHQEWAGSTPKWIKEGKLKLFFSENRKTTASNARCASCRAPRAGDFKRSRPTTKTDSACTTPDRATRPQTFAPPWGSKA